MSYNFPPNNSMKNTTGHFSTKVVGLGSLYPVFNTYSTPNKLKSTVTSVPKLDQIINSQKRKLTHTAYVPPYKCT